MDSTFPPIPVPPPDPREAWELVRGQLRGEMSKADFEAWVDPLRPLSCQGRTFSIGAINPYARDWVETRLKSRVERILTGVLNQPVDVKVIVANGLYAQPGAEVRLPVVQEVPIQPEAPTRPARKGRLSGGSDEIGPEAPNRKVMLQRAYGSERARLIQPERGMFVTLYYFNNWLPLLGHSAWTVILAARSMCYWNPMTGELRNTVETEMGELARRAAVSLRTVKDVLNQELVRRYFLRYIVRRMHTPNGVRTAGILMQVRMDDPLTPEDQAAQSLPEDEHWFTIPIEDDEEE